ncbi:hypothetical protein ACMCNP_01645 [Candidatus Acidulodesulfobacterium sp. H_13]|uniref:hypothetical protein n=1 Tax=Candidatus Acidulodesulfobacterium sp. H_13 TaxID=3395470 RepID=UPI003AF55846
MTEIKGSDFHSDLQKIFGYDDRRNGNGINPLVMVLLVFLIVATWFFISLYYLSYINYSKKYNIVLDNLSYKLKNDMSRSDRIKTNLTFFKSVNKNQVNVSYVLYLLSLHRFGKSYVRSLTVNDGRIDISIFSLENSFRKNLGIMRDYALYLNIYDLRMHTGRFGIASLIEEKTGKKSGVVGTITSSRFK